MDPNQLLAQLAQPIKEIARVEADRAALAALTQARADMVKGFVITLIVAVAIGKFWR